MPISSFAHNSQDLLNKVRDDGLIALESSRNNNKLTAPMRDTLLHTLQLILTELKDRLDNIPTINFNNNLCNTNAHKGKVRYLADSGKLQTCNGDKWILIPSKTFEPTEVETDEVGIKIWFHMHYDDTDFPTCPRGYFQLSKGETKKGRFTKNRRSTLCYQKLPTKTVPIGSKCVKDYKTSWQDGNEFILEYREGIINKVGSCISGNKTGTLRQAIGKDTWTRDLPYSHDRY